MKKKNQKVVPLHPVLKKSKNVNKNKGKIHPDEKKDKDGNVVGIYLRYYDGPKHLNVPRDMYPEFKTKVEAQAYCDIENNLLKIVDDIEEFNKNPKHKKKIPLGNLARARNKFKLARKFGNHWSHLQEYISYIKQDGKSPNSWQSSETYLRDYVFHYFLMERKIANYNRWYRHYHEFKEWLKTATSIKTKSALSWSSKNHCIRTLNGYMKFLLEKNLILPMNVVKCESFPDSLIRQTERTYKDIFTEEAYNNLLLNLNYSKNFFRILYHTGMRFNELFSLAFCDVFSNKNNLPSFMTKTYDKIGEKVYGYILLQDQIAGKTRNSAFNETTNSFKRKPLKSKKTISAKNSRLIPIMDEETWKIIIENKKRAASEYLKNSTKFASKRDFFLLDVDMNKLRREFHKVSPERSYHSCRHSFITLLCGKLIEKGVEPEPILKQITGITSDVLENYIHTYERFVLETVMKGQSDGADELFELASDT